MSAFYCTGPRRRLSTLLQAVRSASQSRYEGSLSVATADGFDECMCSTNSLLGRGVYFTGSSNKRCACCSPPFFALPSRTPFLHSLLYLLSPLFSDQYTKACDRGLRYMILARVALGHPLLLPRGDRLQHTSGLERVPHAKGGRRFDSAVGRPRDSTEFVITKGARAQRLSCTVHALSP